MERITERSDGKTKGKVTRERKLKREREWERERERLWGIVIRVNFF